MSKETGGPAFPAEEYLLTDDPNVCNPARHVGMTLRDYFAAKVIGYAVDHCTTYSRSAKEAYKIADAMLEARKND